MTEKYSLSTKAFERFIKENNKEKRKKRRKKLP